MKIIYIKNIIYLKITLLFLDFRNLFQHFYLLISNFSATFNTRKSYDYSFRGLFSEGFPLLAFLNIGAYCYI